MEFNFDQPQEHAGTTVTPRDENRQRSLPFQDDDHVARVRRAREAAELEMRKFGDVSEYTVRKIQGGCADRNCDLEGAYPPTNTGAEDE